MNLDEAEKPFLPIARKTAELQTYYLHTAAAGPPMLFSHSMIAFWQKINS
jgi:hypothetical protein